MFAYFASLKKAFFSQIPIVGPFLDATFRLDPVSWLEWLLFGTITTAIAYVGLLCILDRENFFVLLVVLYMLFPAIVFIQLYPLWCFFLLKRRWRHGETPTTSLVAVSETTNRNDGSFKPITREGDKGEYTASSL